MELISHLVSDIFFDVIEMTGRISLSSDTCGDFDTIQMTHFSVQMQKRISWTRVF